MCYVLQECDFNTFLKAFYAYAFYFHITLILLYLRSQESCSWQIKVSFIYFSPNILGSCLNTDDHCIQPTHTSQSFIHIWYRFLFLLKGAFSFDNWKDKWSQIGTFLPSLQIEGIPWLTSVALLPTRAGSRFLINFGKNLIFKDKRTSAASLAFDAVKLWNEASAFPVLCNQFLLLQGVIRPTLSLLLVIGVWDDYKIVLKRSLMPCGAW